MRQVPVDVVFCSRQSQGQSSLAQPPPTSTMAFVSLLTGFIRFGRNKAVVFGFDRSQADFKFCPAGA